MTNLEGQHIVKVQASLNTPDLILVYNQSRTIQFEEYNPDIWKVVYPYGKAYYLIELKQDGYQTSLNECKIEYSVEFLRKTDWQSW